MDRIRGIRSHHIVFRNHAGRFCEVNFTVPIRQNLEGLLTEARLIIYLVASPHESHQ
jgi:hypothetical protein